MARDASPTAEPVHRSARTRRRKASTPGRSWWALVLAPVGDGQTRRRGSDIVRAVLAALTLLLCWVAVRAGVHVEVDIVSAISSPPEGIKWVVTSLFWAGTVGLAMAAVALFALARRWRVLIHLLVAAASATVIVALLDALAGPNAERSNPTQFAGRDLHFPVLFLSVAAAVVCTSLPYLSRTLQRLAAAVIALGAVATLVHGSGLPLAILASFAIGWGVTAGIHLAVGSPLGLPSTSDVMALLAELAVDVTDVVAAATQEWGVARYTGRHEGAEIAISVYGRDASDTQLLAKSLRFLFYRDSGPMLSLTRRQQVEHEAYVNLMAQRAGASVPDVLVAGPAGPARDALLVTSAPAGTPLSAYPAFPLPVAEDEAEDEAEIETENETDEATAGESGAGELGAGESGVGADGSELRMDDPVLHVASARAFFAQVALLHQAGIAHGSLSRSTVLVAEDGSVTLCDLRQALTVAPTEIICADTAAALATVSLVLGPDATVEAAVAELGTDQVIEALPYLQKTVVATARWSDERGLKGVLARLRSAAATATGAEEPKLIEAKRIGWGTLLMVVGSLIGGWALLGVLVHVTQSWSTIKGANWVWVAVVFVLAQSAYPAIAVTTMGSVTQPLPYLRCVALEMADTFVGLAGGSMAVLATRVRYFQKEGFDPTVAVSSGVLVSTASWIVKGALFLIALPFALGNLHFTSDPATGTSSNHGTLIVTALVVVVLVGIALGLIFAVPRWRRLARAKLRPKVSELWTHLKILATHPRNLVEIFGGNLVAQLVVAMALGAALHAFGDHLGLATLVVVLTLGSMLGGVSPVPGGMGVVEAGMILGLTAAGINESDAVAAVFVQRLFTAYLPPIWGWFTLVWMRKKEYL